MSVLFMPVILHFQHQLAATTRIKLPNGRTHEGEVTWLRSDKQA